MTNVEKAAELILASRGSVGNMYRAIDEALSRRALKRTDGNISRAAATLGVHRRTYQRKLQRLNTAGRQDGRSLRKASKSPVFDNFSF